MAISKKSFVNLDLQGNSLVNPTIGANADMTKAGSFQYNSVSNRLEYYNGATIETVANLNDLTGALDFQGGYDASTNTPDLTAPAAGAVKQGYYWVVTAAGTFFTEPLAIGDSLFAKVDDPSALTDWVIVQGNVDLASETTPGITYLASSAQVAAGTEDGAYAVNPLKLQEKIDSLKIQGVILTSQWTYDAGSGYYYHEILTPTSFSYYTNNSFYDIGGSETPAFGGQPIEIYSQNMGYGFVVISNSSPSTNIGYIISQA